MPQAVCGGISTGSDKIRSGYGNGDCLYFDFEHLVFAVADGTERFPWASRDLLQRLSERLSRSGSPETVRDWKDMMNTEIYAGQKYQHKTTFSSVALRREGQDVFLIIANGGDSVVTVMDGLTGKIRRQTGRNMDFAGRSKEIVDVTEHRVPDPNHRVLLSTDGFDDVWRFCHRRSLVGSARDVLERVGLDGVGEVIFGMLEGQRGRFEYDDVGFILLDPGAVERVKGKALIMGGTRPFEEKHYRLQYTPQAYDRWIPDAQWAGQEEMLAGAGIRVLKAGQC
ncbi:MAG: hypothetical protein PHG54_14080 [Smithellaceae bacterium]|nr:hypothetical protein [Smithellaceae bacterium]